MTGIVDGPLGGGNPKAIELYISGTVDLSGYEVQRATNANNFSTRISLSGTYTDEYFYLIGSGNAGVDRFNEAFGADGNFANRIVSGSVSGNGDDKFRLVLAGSDVTIDQVGGLEGIQVDVYEDSYLYRNDNTGPDGGWVPGNWKNVNNNNSLDNLDAAGVGAAVPFGSYKATPAGPRLTVSAGTDLAEPATNGNFTFTLSETSTSDVTITYTLAGTATAGTDYTDAGAGTTTITAGNLSTDVAFEVIDDTEQEQDETIELTISSISSTTYSGTGSSAELQIFDNEVPSTVLISTVQGSGLTSPLEGQLVTIQGVVVCAYQGDDTQGLGGFFLQEEDADADGDASTSEGIWVYQNPAEAYVEVAFGELVTVTGEVAEFGGLTELLTNVRRAAVTVQGNAAMPSRSSIDFPLSQNADLERFEGMIVEFDDELSITGTNDLARFGSLELSSPERLAQYTECNTPDVDGYAAYLDAADLRTIVLDDGRSGQNLVPRLPDGQAVTSDGMVRGGNTLPGLFGVLDERFTGYRLQPLGYGGTAKHNARPTSRPAVGGDLRIASMNVLNYFNGDGAGGGFPTSRGADTQDEFLRQQTKIVKAICELDAAAVGLIEIENDGYDATSALQSLIDAIAAECGKSYNFVRSPQTGGDAIQVAIIYQPALLSEVGRAAALTSPTDVFSLSRVPVAQTFEVVGASNTSFGEQFTLVVNHFKSKGSGRRCTDTPDDGAGNCDVQRTEAAQAVADWVATNPTGVADPDYLVVGDLNAYRMEVPIKVFTDAGYVNTVVANAAAGSFPCGGSPSYVFGGFWGSLDYALASASMADQVTGAQDWAVNAAEPTLFDYNNADNYVADFYRFSDHDPILVGLSLTAPLPVELTSFGAELLGNGNVAVSWSTASEVDASHFEVLRSMDAVEFMEVVRVSATGAGDYSLLDIAPLRGTSY